MVNSVSKSSAVTEQYTHHPPAARPPVKPKETPKQDTVVLSPKAQAADPDHDGD